MKSVIYCHISDMESFFNTSVRRPKLRLSRMSIILPLFVIMVDQAEPCVLLEDAV
jgi:hypothetical protein